jgi:hypothetical protein
MGRERLEQKLKAQDHPSQHPAKPQLPLQQEMVVVPVLLVLSPVLMPLHPGKQEWQQSLGRGEVVRVPEGREGKCCQRV